MNSTALTIVDVDQHELLISRIREALAGGDAVLPFAEETRESAEMFAQIHPVVAEGLALVIRTSGSTGTPKAVGLSASALVSSAEATLKVLGGPGQWLVALSPQVIAGAQMIVRSILGETEPVFTSPHSDPESFVAAANTLTHARRYTSLVPVQLSRLLGTPASRDALRRFDAVLLGGQAAPVELLKEAEQAGIRVIKTYGASETSGGCVYDGFAIGNTQLRIHEGELWVAGSCLATGYLDDDELTASRFVSDGGTRWFLTHDAAAIRDGKLVIEGRLDNVFVSGGVKVSLDVLERLVQSTPGWRGAVVIAVTDQTWGERAMVISAADAEPSEPSFETLAATIRAALGAAAVPIAHRVVPEIPLLPSGKPDRLALTKHR
jgi:O-succinylbenzoic acid--CoA ligase